MATPQINSFLTAMFPHDVTVEPYVSQDRQGTRQYGAPVTRKALVFGERKEHALPGGQRVVSNWTAIFAGHYGVRDLDRFTLPAQFSLPVAPGESASDLALRQREVAHVCDWSDENGPHTQAVYFK